MDYDFNKIIEELLSSGDSIDTIANTFVNSLNEVKIAKEAEEKAKKEAEEKAKAEAEAAAKKDAQKLEDFKELIILINDFLYNYDYIPIEEYEKILNETDEEYTKYLKDLESFFSLIGIIDDYAGILLSDDKKDAEGPAKTDPAAPEEKEIKPAPLTTVTIPAGTTKIFKPDPNTTIKVHAGGKNDPEAKKIKAEIENNIAKINKNFEAGFNGALRKFLGF